jgi:hypothetical protein
MQLAHCDVHFFLTAMTNLIHGLTLLKVQELVVQGKEVQFWDVQLLEVQ